MKFKFLEAQGSKQSYYNKKFKRQHLKDIDGNFVVHHLDDNKKTILKDGSEIKLTDYSNCIFVEILPGDMNFSHNLLTLIQKYGSLTKLMDKLCSLRIITVNRNEKGEDELNITTLSEYIK